MEGLDKRIAEGRDRQAHEHRLAVAAARQAEAAAKSARSADDRAALALRTNTALSAISSLHGWYWIGLMSASSPLAFVAEFGRCSSSRPPRCSCSPSASGCGSVTFGGGSAPTQIEHLTFPG